MRLICIQGFSLLEAIISLFLVSILLFGLDAAQIYSLKESKNAYFSSMALNQINNGLERLIALENNEALQNQITIWNAENQAVLPDGFGTITGQYPNYIITVYWGGHLHHCQKQQVGSSGCLRKKIQMELQ
jgi:Tfp pilus assembly protein PilV